jgi:hypothetical protein
MLLTIIVNSTFMTYCTYNIDGRTENFESTHENMEEMKKNETDQTSQMHDEDTSTQFHIWKFTRGDAITMVIGGIFGGIFSGAVMRLL